jgi:hypothetical protein
VAGRGVMAELFRRLFPLRSPHTCKRLVHCSSSTLSSVRCNDDCFSYGVRSQLNPFAANTSLTLSETSHERELVPPGEPCDHAPVAK